MSCSVVTEHALAGCVSVGGAVLGEHRRRAGRRPVRGSSRSIVDQAARAAHARRRSALCGRGRDLLGGASARSSWNRAGVTAACPCVTVRGRGASSNAAPNSALSAGACSSSTMNSARMRSTSAAASIACALVSSGRNDVADRLAQLPVVQRAVSFGCLRRPRLTCRSPRDDAVRRARRRARTPGGCRPLRGLLLTSRNPHPPGSSVDPHVADRLPSEARAGRADHAADRFDPHDRRLAAGQVVPHLRRRTADGIVVEVHEHLDARDVEGLAVTERALRAGRSCRWCRPSSRTGTAAIPSAPPKLRLARKLSQWRTPHEWSRHAGASICAVRPSSVAVPCTRHDTWKLFEKIAPAAPFGAGERLARPPRQRTVVVDDLEVQPAAFAVEHEAQPLAVVEQSLRTGDHAVARRARARRSSSLWRNRVPSSWYTPHQRLAVSRFTSLPMPVVAAETDVAVAPREVRALLPGRRRRRRDADLRRRGHAPQGSSTRASSAARGSRPTASPTG